MDVRTIILIILVLLCIKLLFDRFIITKTIGMVEKEIIEEVVSVKETLKKIEESSSTVQEENSKLKDLIHRLTMERDIFILKYYKTKEKDNDR